MCSSIDKGKDLRSWTCPDGFSNKSKKNIREPKFVISSESGCWFCRRQVALLKWASGYSTSGLGCAFVHTRSSIWSCVPSSRGGL